MLQRMYDLGMHQYYNSILNGLLYIIFMSWPITEWLISKTYNILSK